MSPQLQELVDKKQLALNTAVELSYLMPDEQARVAETMGSEHAPPSLPQAQKMKKPSRAGKLNVNTKALHRLPLRQSPNLGDKQYTSFAESIADLKTTTIVACKGVVHSRG